MYLKILSFFLVAFFSYFNLLAQQSSQGISTALKPAGSSVQVIYLQEKKPSSAVVVGTISSAEFTQVSCGIAELLNVAKAEAALKGGNALYVTSIKPDKPAANCFTLEAEILKFSEPYSSSPNPAYSSKIHSQTAGDSIVYTEIAPVFPGGREGMINFLNTTVKYPEAAIRGKLSGVVAVSCVLDTTGKLTEITVAEGLHPALDQEALRIISAMPEWVPGYQNGKAVPVKMTLPVRFTIHGKAPKKKKTD